MSDAVDAQWNKVQLEAIRAELTNARAENERLKREAAEWISDRDEVWIPSHDRAIDERDRYRSALDLLRRHYKRRVGVTATHVYAVADGALTSTTPPAAEPDDFDNLVLEMGGRIFAEETRCRGCGDSLLPENYRVADCCPCNGPRGMNHGLVAKETCTCKECDPAQTGSTRYPYPPESAASRVVLHLDSATIEACVNEVGFKSHVRGCMSCGGSEGKKCIFGLALHRTEKRLRSLTSEGATHVGAAPPVALRPAWGPMVTFTLQQWATFCEHFRIPRDEASDFGEAIEADRTQRTPGLDGATVEACARVADKARDLVDTMHWRNCSDRIARDIRSLAAQPRGEALRLLDDAALMWHLGSIAVGATKRGAEDHEPFIRRVGQELVAAVKEYLGQPRGEKL